MDEINELIGLKQVKQKVEAFIAIAKFNKLRQEQGAVSKNISYHSLFLGNPGTGKTTVARLLGNAMFEAGIISSDKLVETSRGDLVGRYIGETAIKTREVLDSATGGILFVDEAYTLSNSGENDFGKEAVETIMKYMEDNRDKIMIIFAGYTKEMEDFVTLNPGIASRISHEFLFEDYTDDEMVEIGLKELERDGYLVDPEYYRAVLLNKYYQDDDRSNARYVRNFNDKVIMQFAIRHSKNPNADIFQILNEDLDNVE